MEKIHGLKEYYTPIRYDESRIIVCHNFKLDEDGVNGTWYETYLYKKQKWNPTTQDIKDYVIADINSYITNKIVNGFPYIIKHGEQVNTEVNIWLSKENQNDFHVMHTNSDILNFPIRYKVGELKNGNPVYEEFANVEEIHDICTSITNYVLECQKEGWEKKDAIDWDLYTIPSEASE